MGTRFAIFSGIWVVLLSLFAMSLSAADDGDPVWTETIRSKDGNFAVSVNTQNRTVIAIRTDERAGESPHLRVKILRAEGAALEQPLKPIERPDQALRYAARVANWNGILSGFTLESSADGKSWKALGSFKSP